jgi:UDPglucose 6-dehydrogenase
MNEIAGVASVTGAQIDDVARIVGLDARVGGSHLRAGLGFGGTSLQKDLRALAETARRHGARSSTFDAALAVNDGQRSLATDALLEAAFGARGSPPTVAILGLAYKAGTDDVSESPGVDVAMRLRDAGCRVQAHDPLAARAVRSLLPAVDVRDDAYDAVHGADAVLVATDWPTYAEMNWHQVRAQMRGSLVFDGRNVLDPDAIECAGLEYRSFGRPRRAVHPAVPAPAAL